MEQSPDTCPHMTQSNITFSVAGKPVYKDQCLKCYDDIVIFSPLNTTSVQNTE